MQSSVTMLQMRRLAREIGLGDAFACFQDKLEATRFWREVERGCEAAGAM